MARVSGKKVGRQSMSVELTGDLTKSIDKFASEVAERAVRAGGARAANVLYEEMRALAPVGDTGTLKNSIYRYRDITKSTFYRHVYLVGPNKRKAPHWHLLEYGYWRRYPVVIIDGQFKTLTDQPLADPKWQPPQPYIRPTYAGKIRQAIEAGKSRMAEVVREITSGK